MFQAGRWALIAMGLVFVGTALSGARSSGPPAAAQFTAKGELLFPADYRRWIFLSAGHGMTYSEAASTAADPAFDNVFVDPGAYDAFLKTGHWREGTVLVLESRAGSSIGSINKHGAFQTTVAPVIEVHVHDSKQFTGGWGFFTFIGEKPAAIIPMTANCYSCHQQHAAVDTTFVQFYPTLLPVATAKASLSAAYLAAEKAQK